MCTRCGKADPVQRADFRDSSSFQVACPKCSSVMTRVITDIYSFCCETCDISIRLADLLPNEDAVSRSARGDRAGD